MLLLLAGGVVAVFVTAWFLNPYKDGRVWLTETHTQLNLAPCTFKVLTDLPCPSCGMTSSFALLMHGDLGNSLRANSAGTVLALMMLTFLPWSLVSVVRARLWGVRDVEYLIVWAVLGFMVVMFARWGIIMALEWFAATR